VEIKMVMSNKMNKKQKRSRKDDVESIFEKFQSYFIGSSTEPFSDMVLMLANEPLNVGEVENPNGFGCMKGSCGESISIFLRVTEGIISDSKFLTDGCGAILACGSAVTELIKGKTPYEAAKTYPQTIVKYLGGLPASHLHCSVIAVQALQKALENLRALDCINRNLKINDKSSNNS
jgi:nitrogen fixation NifU-like protein